MCTAKTTTLTIWHIVTFQKKAIALGVAASLAMGPTNLYAAEGAEGAGGAAGGITIGAADSLAWVCSWLGTDCGGR